MVRLEPYQDSYLLPVQFSLERQLQKINDAGDSRIWALVVSINFVHRMSTRHYRPLLKQT